MSDWTYTPKTDAECEEIAQGMCASKIFHSGMIDDASVNLIGSIFLPLVLIEQKFLNQLEEQGVVQFYEHMDKAGPRTVNGYPMFMSVQFLNKEDNEKVITRAREIHAFLTHRREAADGDTETSK